jgi:ubiquinone/menaquinone biosynthesis C-methylase UbiE
MPTTVKKNRSAAAKKPAAQPSPENIFNTLNAYQRTEALKSAIELDLFTAVDDGQTGAADLAKRCGASERGVRILCDYLTVIGFLTKKGGRYGLPPDSAVFLSRNSPACMASISGFLGHPELSERFKSLTEAIKKGGSVEAQGTVAPDHPIWVQFARSMAPMMALPAQGIARLLGAAKAPALKVLDIAAGHGVFGITLAQQNTKARVTALDWAGVLAVAQENAKAAGVADRYNLLAGSAFDVEFGSGYDVVLLTNFLHHFDEPTNVRLLRKVHASLAPGGRALALEFVPNEDRVSPPTPAAFSLIMLSSTPSGDAYTHAELDRMFRAAGFSATELHPLEPTPQSVVLARKK